MVEVNHWYRAHHGTVSDPKFALVAVKAGQGRGNVIALWHHLLEEASASADRGNPGAPDFEVLDLMLGMEEGGAKRIYDALIARGMIEAPTGRISQWDKRQPKREREEEPGAAAERKRRQRAREKGADEEAGRPEQDPEDNGETNEVTPSHAESHQLTPIGEEKREEYSVPKGTDGGEPPADRRKKERSPEDAAKASLWRSAIAVLSEGGCKSEDVARSFMGKLVKDYGLDAVREAVAAAATEQPADAREYLKATCMHLAKERTRPVTVPDNPQVQQTAAAHAAEAARVGSRDPAHIAAARAAAAAARERRLGTAKDAIDAVTGGRDASD